MRAETELNWSADLSILEWEGVWVNWPGRPIAIPVDESGNQQGRQEALRKQMRPPRVRSLELYAVELRGEIPVALEDLTELETLALEFRHFPPRHIPPELGQLAHLETLKLSDSLNGPIPAELGELKNLTSVSIRGHGFTGCLPSQWEKHWVEDSSGGQLEPCE